MKKKFLVFSTIDLEDKSIKEIEEKILDLVSESWPDKIGVNNKKVVIRKVLKYYHPKLFKTITIYLSPRVANFSFGGVTQKDESFSIIFDNNVYIANGFYYSTKWRKYSFKGDDMIPPGSFENFLEEVSPDKIRPILFNLDLYTPVSNERYLTTKLKIDVEV